MEDSQLPRRFPARPPESDHYTWLGVMMLVFFTVGFLALITVVMPILNWQVLLSLLAVVAMGITGHLIMGRWVAHVIAQSEQAESLDEQIAATRDDKT